MSSRRAGSSVRPARPARVPSPRLLAARRRSAIQRPQQKRKSTPDRVPLSSPLHRSKRRLRGHRSVVALQSHQLRRKQHRQTRRSPTAILFNPVVVQHHPQHITHHLQKHGKPPAGHKLFNALQVRHHETHLRHRERQKLQQHLHQQRAPHATAAHSIASAQPKPRVLMFGWEFPPQSSGGLGTACEGLSKALVQQGVQLAFVVPHSHPGHPEVRIQAASEGPVTFHEVPSPLAPYLSAEEYERMLHQQVGDTSGGMYGSTLFLEVHRYARAAQRIARRTPCDVIHAHDWMTFPAAIAAKRSTGKPFIAHVHATEFDRSGDNPYPAVYHLEREGLHAADHIIAVSNYTKQKIVEHYGIAPEKVTVVHNAVEHQCTPPTSPSPKLPGKTVLFLGRITLQKGPDYFLAAAKKVLAHEPNVRFIIAGKGDMERKIIEQAAALGIAKNVLFAGFAKGPEVDALYRMADLYVMPSVSEPFGITPLEALRNDTPVLISKQSGVSEVLKNAMRVDFWDIDEMANKIISALRYPALREELRDRGKAEIAGLRWEDSATECLDVYRGVLGWR